MSANNPEKEIVEGWLHVWGKPLFICYFSFFFFIKNIYKIIRFSTCIKFVHASVRYEDLLVSLCNTWEIDILHGAVLVLQGTRPIKRTNRYIDQLSWAIWVHRFMGKKVLFGPMCVFVMCVSFPRHRSLSFFPLPSSHPPKLLYGCWGPCKAIRTMDLSTLQQQRF